MRLFIDSDTVFDVGDRVLVKIAQQRMATVVGFAVEVKSDAEDGTSSFLVEPHHVEIVESASDLIRGWLCEQQIRDHAKKYGVSIVDTLAMLARLGLGQL